MGSRVLITAGWYNYLSNRVFENCEAIVEDACEAWNKLISPPQTITSIGMRDWAHVRQLFLGLVLGPLLLLCSKGINLEQRDNASLICDAGYCHVGVSRV